MPIDEDTYEYVEAYIHLSKGYKYMIERHDNYQEHEHMLTFAIHNGEQAGYLLRLLAICHHNQGYL